MRKKPQKETTGQLGQTDRERACDPKISVNNSKLSFYSLNLKSENRGTVLKSITEKIKEIRQPKATESE
jgi:hypothetical protein